MPTNKELRNAVVMILADHFARERRERGDAFATEDEMQAILSDPIAWLSMLRGEDAYVILERAI